jgi:hypothetical protein
LDQKAKASVLALAVLDTSFHQRSPDDRRQGVVAGLIRKLLQLADYVVM